MLKIIKDKLKLSYEKTDEALLLVHKTMISEFSTYGMTVEQLKSPSVVISYLVYKKCIVYCSINQLQLLADEKTAVCNFSYAYLHPFFRRLGIGEMFFKQREAKCAEIFPNTNFTATVRVSNKASLKIMQNNNYIAVCNYKYRNGDSGIKFIKIMPIWKIK